MVVYDVCQRRRNAACANIERKLYGSRAIGEKTLSHHRDRPQNQGLGIAEFEHSDQDEKEIHRKRAGNAREIHLQPGCKDGNSQITNELRDVLAALVNSAVDESA